MPFTISHDNISALTDAARKARAPGISDLERSEAQERFEALASDVIPPDALWQTLCGDDPTPEDIEKAKRRSELLQIFYMGIAHDRVAELEEFLASHDELADLAQHTRVLDDPPRSSFDLQAAFADSFRRVGLEPPTLELVEDAFDPHPGTDLDAPDTAEHAAPDLRLVADPQTPDPQTPDPQTPDPQRSTVMPTTDTGAITARLVREKETKNTVRFTEVPDADTGLVLGSLYVPKTTLARLGDPDELTITLGQAR